MIEVRTVFFLMVVIEIILKVLLVIGFKMIFYTLFITPYKNKWEIIVAPFV